METQNTTKELEKPPLVITQKPWGTIGVFAEYPPELPNLLERRVYDIIQQDSDDPGNILGTRNKFPIEIKLPSGRKLPLYVKEVGSSSVNAKGTHEEYLRLKEKGALLKQGLDEASEQSDPEKIASAEYLLKWNQDEMEFRRFRSSALHEIMINRQTTQAYEQAYGEPLPIEKAVGLIVTKAGYKWVLFEQVKNLVNFATLPENMKPRVQERANAFIELMKSRLAHVGINTSDLNTFSIRNILIVGNPKTPESLTFCLIDSELWKRTDDKNS